MRQWEVLNKNKDLLLLIFWVGRGVMFSSHAYQYMEIIHGQSKSTTWRELKELEKHMIIDIKDLFNVNYIKLKKAALRFILDKTNDEISSVSYKARALKRSAFINEIILNAIKNKQNFTAENVISIFLQTSTLFDKDKNHTIYLESLLELIEKDDQMRHEYLSNEVKSLLDNGKSLYDNTHINFNHMASINMFMLNVPKNNEEGFLIGILNLNNDLKGKKAIEKMDAATKYLNMFFPFWDKKFIIYCEDENIVKALKYELNKSKRELDYRVKVKSLNITSKIFKGTKFIS